MSERQVDDNWGDGAAYEGYMGRWSRLVAPRFLRWLDPGSGLTWLDVGCGTGALTAAIMAEAAPTAMHACDPAKAHADYTRHHIDDPRLTVSVAGAGDLPVSADGYDYIVSGLVLNFIPAPAEAMTEMRGLLSPGGTIAAYVWDYGGTMDMIRLFWAAARVLDPSTAGQDEDKRFLLGDEAALGKLFNAEGLADVQTEGITVSTTFDGFSDFWATLQGGQGPAPTYLASLTDDNRAAFRIELERLLPGDSAGRVTLAARAWAVRGRVYMSRQPA
jgi:SAM-dependent methyltransferase